jgi:hypothetical protein
MRRIALAALALAVVASAAVYVSEGGDVVYFSTLGQFGALNGLGLDRYFNYRAVC